MKLKTLEDLFEHELKEMFCCEKQLMNFLPTMLGKSKDSRLKEILEIELKETLNHKERLNSVFNVLGIIPNEGNCNAITELIKESEVLLDDEAVHEVRDAAIIMTIQKTIHYQLASYATAIKYAEKLGLKNQLQLLEKTYNEEDEVDHQLNLLCKEQVVTREEISALKINVLS